MVQHRALKGEGPTYEETFPRGQGRVRGSFLLLYELANTLRYNPRFGIEEVKRAINSGGFADCASRA
ncbi:MAG: hypothetical protein ACUVTD_08880 [Nitrososphaerales archaeon]